MSSLGRLNLSFNRLQGKLDKQYARWPATAFDGNLNLCGSPLQNCKDIKSANGETGLSESSVVIISAISTTFAVILLLLGAALFFKHRREALRRGSALDSAYSSSSSQAQRRPLFDNAAAKNDFRWIDIMEATNNLSEEFIIGSGGSGTIYKAELFTGETVAIKRIVRKDDPMLDRSFAREIKTLGRIRHRHLVRLLGYVAT
ncbi:UNVERIFIED_CONTAM: LRR receptor-like serine/threonine-protein kinase GSO1 [Sesamum radiatum]|uniref:non-specific serine/threonine protein kinase n=1 Tax=Sesamum radiatum TaxID=300843 RepID=A0AAW2T0Y8_SESRA